VYLPDLPTPSYRNLLETLDQEFTYAFGGCTILRNLDGSYLSHAGVPLHDSIHIIYTDSPFSFEQHSATLSRYLDELRSATFEALNEEAVLVVAHKVFHSE
jgi:hypothetical protein